MVNGHRPAKGPGQRASLDCRLRAGRAADVGPPAGQRPAGVRDDAVAAHGQSPQRRLGRAAPAGHAASLGDVPCRRYEAGSSAVSSAGADSAVGARGGGWASGGSGRSPSAGAASAVAACGRGWPSVVSSGGSVSAARASGSAASGAGSSASASSAAASSTATSCTSSTGASATASSTRPSLASGDSRPSASASSATASSTSPFSPTSSAGGSPATYTLPVPSSAWWLSSPQKREPGSAALGQRRPLPRIAAQRPPVSSSG